MMMTWKNLKDCDIELVTDQEQDWKTDISAWSKVMYTWDPSGQEISAKLWVANNQSFRSIQTIKFYQFAWDDTNY